MVYILHIERQREDWNELYRSIDYDGGYWWLFHIIEKGLPWFPCWKPSDFLKGGMPKASGNNPQTRPPNPIIKNNMRANQTLRRLNSPDIYIYTKEHPTNHNRHNHHNPTPKTKARHIFGAVAPFLQTFANFGDQHHTITTLPATGEFVANDPHRHSQKQPEPLDIIRRC